ncbi:low molecular weight protein-tyrosine-phosphatase [Corynebacterium sp. J010B-136]|uniref:low molecular weight protein-tyrosine-phosphatase n=1 Tax=Corynebacterium sp. J010B-136 TaxID=2099401 RepID=UPI000CF9F6B9|nr:low molecular weight protein-tyrosine-phosphatase [Corynebacterium sp. J010B-136]PQM73374.1 protein-tyrosine-phosphatase [Corynebacterium sp. J010B-136]
MSPAFKSSSSQPSNPLHICFVCTGNICRSPMAEVIVHDALEAAGLAQAAHTSSCGLGGWHVGEKADERTIAELRQSGHDGDRHRAEKLGPVHRTADIFIAMDDGHVDGLLAEGISPERIRMMRSFDPQSPEGANVDDPYYGSQADFARTRQEIEEAVPGLIEWVKDHLNS